MKRGRAAHVVEPLPASNPNLFNPYRDRGHDEADAEGPAARLDRLERHLACDARLVLCGEAAGYAGCRAAGIAFTSERLLLDGAIPRVAVDRRLTTRERPLSEQSATIVWKALYALGVAEETVLFNALQMHPRKPGQPLSNRTPTPAELALGAESLRRLLAMFPRARVVAVGRSAERALAAIAVEPAAYIRHPASGIRHPANGGAREFAAGLRTLANAL